MSHILEAMNDEECEPDFLNISNAEGLFDDFEEVSYSTNTIAQELIADIMQECSEQELFERFERECAELQEDTQINFDNIAIAVESDEVKNISNK